jgi:hypothetical protein
MIAVLRPFLALRPFNYKRSYKKYEVSREEIRRNLPYVLIATSNDNEYILKNREYFALGQTDESENIDVLKLKISIPEDMRTLLDERYLINRKDIYLYNDGCVPWSGKRNAKKYCEKIEFLKSLSIDGGESLTSKIESILGRDLYG